jgi:hypothetical protein
MIKKWSQKNMKECDKRNSHINNTRKSSINREVLSVYFSTAGVYNSYEKQVHSSCGISKTKF